MLTIGCTLEIEFLNEDAKVMFKRITQTEIGKCEELNPSLIFPYPRPVKDITDVDREFWELQLWGAIGGFFHNTAEMREEGLTLTYYFETEDEPPLNFLRSLYFNFPIVRARLLYDSDNDLVYIKPDGEKCFDKKCQHNQCNSYVATQTYDLDWRELPHPVFQIKKTFDWLKMRIVGLTDNELASAYHHFIHRHAVFPKCPKVRPYTETRKLFDEQLVESGIAYLELMALVSGYSEPMLRPEVTLPNGQNVEADKYLSGIYCLSWVKPTREED